MNPQSKPYMVDISFLQPVIEAYRNGLFDNSNIPIRVMNALESLSQYGDVKQVSPQPLRKVRIDRV